VRETHRFHRFTRLPVRSTHPTIAVLAALVLALCAGCRKAPGPQFPLNTQGRDLVELIPDDAERERRLEAVRQTLSQLFGTPDAPRAPSGAGLDLQLLRAAAGPVGGEADGTQRGLLRRHCVGCHGIAGDGTGPAAGSLDPYPRDYRLGVFKYTSTSDGAKPCRDDLERTLLRGIAGTAMPSFAQLRQREIAALLEYVKYLSIRGQAELALLELVVDASEPLPLNVQMVLDDAVLPAAELWEAPERLGLIVQPPPRPAVDTPEALAASIARGRQMFLRDAGQCVRCHGLEGDGAGQERELYDDWNKPKRGATPEETARLAARFALPIQRTRPRNFREGVFRGGNGPRDLYWRICVGIKGTPMPAAGPSRASSGAFTPEEIWPLVDYVRSLAGSGQRAVASGPWPVVRGQ